MNNDNLLIIGNGFDLKCGLKSSYNDFFNSNIIAGNQDLVNLFLQSINRVFANSTTDFDRTNEVQLQIYRTNYEFFLKEIATLTSDSSFSFWNLVFRETTTKNSDWNNIEKRIEEIVCNNKDVITNINKIILYYEMLHTMNYHDIIPIDLNKIQKQNFILALYVYIKNIEKKNIYLFLLDELKKFEGQFLDYLTYEVNHTNKYQDRIAGLLKKIYRENPSIIKSNVINFNYTTIQDKPNINIESNVHGDLDKRNIIFGIDLSNLTHEKGAFFFTKTYRKMHAFEDVKIESFKDQAILDKDINNITFFGHSLNESDYSYFQSIFDYYEIYSSNISLVFYYSIYDPEKTKEIKESYTNAVINLVNTYGKTMANRFHGENFLHKLLLENRIILKEI